MPERPSTAILSKGQLPGKHGHLPAGELALIAGLSWWPWLAVALASAQDLGLCAFVPVLALLRPTAAKAHCPSSYPAPQCVANSKYGCSLQATGSCCDTKGNYECTPGLGERNFVCRKT